MPHQCLTCGKVLEELTEDILFREGCPDCNKKKFTFTNEPMSDNERLDLVHKREGEIRELIRRNREKDIPKADAPEIEPESVKVENEWVGISSEEAPEVIHVVESGVYEINIDKLMEDSPIIINRDGSYMVYLPSIFRKKRKGKRLRKIG